MKKERSVWLDVKVKYETTTTNWKKNQEREDTNSNGGVEEWLTTSIVFSFFSFLQAVWRCSHQEQVRNERWQQNGGGTKGKIFDWIALKLVPILEGKILDLDAGLTGQSLQWPTSQSQKPVHPKHVASPPSYTVCATWVEADHDNPPALPEPLALAGSRNE